MNAQKVVSVTRRIAGVALPLALALGATTAQAQWGILRGNTNGSRGTNNGVYANGNNGYGAEQVVDWSGRVDKEVRIEISGGRASVVPVGDREQRYGRVRELNALPRQDGILTLTNLSGRGRVDVIQQPTSSNGYTAIIRVRDPDSGAGDYHLTAYWQPVGNGRYNNGGYDNGRYDNGRYDNGRNGRNRSDDGRYDDNNGHSDNGRHNGWYKHGRNDDDRDDGRPDDGRGNGHGRGRNGDNDGNYRNY